MIIELTDQNFTKFLHENPLPVLVDCYANGCSYCKMMVPTFQKLSDKLQGKVVFASLDADENPAVVMCYKIRGLPTFLLFDANRELTKVSGYMEMGELEDWIKWNV